METKMKLRRERIELQEALTGMIEDCKHLLIMLRLGKHPRGERF